MEKLSLQELSKLLSEKRSDYLRCKNEIFMESCNASYDSLKANENLVKKKKIFDEIFNVYMAKKRAFRKEFMFQIEKNKYIDRFPQVEDYNEKEFRDFMYDLACDDF